MTEQRAQRIANLTRAAQTKRQDAIARAEAGLRTLIKSNAAVNFRSVAQAGRVSLDFLYRNDELRSRIEHLRAQQRPAQAHKQTSPPAEKSSVVASLTAKLRDAHTENLELRTQLAAAHGELLTLRRRSGTATDNRNVLVADASSTTGPALTPPQT
jgi:hypothetical protein